MPLDFGDLYFSYGDVELASLSVEHSRELAAAAGEDPSIYRFNNAPSNIAETEAYIAKALNSREAGLRHPFAIMFQGRVTGTTSYAEYQPWSWQPGNLFQRRGVPDAVEIGYTWLGKSATRSPCNTAAKYLLLRHAFEEWAVHRVSFQTDERNSVSRAALERVGAKLDGVRRAHKVGADGEIRSSALYSILADEWPATRVHLESKL